MNIPPWLAQATGAMQFANNPANGYKPTFGDGLQGIGHSMMEHYRRQQAQPGAGAPVGIAPAAIQPTAFNPMADLAPPAPVPVDQVQFAPTQVPARAGLMDPRLIGQIPMSALLNRM